MDYKNINRNLINTPENLIRHFNDQISDIEDLIYFNIGEPDFNTPDFIKEAAVQSIAANQSFYAHSRGVLALRQAICDYLKRKYQLAYEAETQILVTAGATQALYVAVTGLCNPGDQFIVVDPNYVIYNSQIIAAGGEVLPIDVSGSQFKLQADDLELCLAGARQAKALIFNHPTNPTGVTYSANEIQAIAEVCRKHGIYVISDEMYAEFTYGGAHVSLAQYLPEATLLINGTSKSHAMTGWRSAFLAGPSALIHSLYPLHQAVLTTITTQVQYASIAAYRDGDEAITRMKKDYQSRRDYLITNLEVAGYQMIYPEGAFYLFVKVPDWYGSNDYQFCLDLARVAKLAVTPGQIFGAAGRGYFRISYVSELAKLRLLCERLGNFQELYYAG